MRGLRGASFRHCLYPRACCWVALLMGGNDNLLPYFTVDVPCIADHSYSVETRLWTVEI